MAVNKNAANLDRDMEAALEEALEAGLGDDIELDDELSLDDFENQVRAAADELADESKGSPEKSVKSAKAAPDSGKDARKEAEPRKQPQARAPAPKPAAPAKKPAASEPKRLVSFSPANDDDTRRDYAAIMTRLQRGQAGGLPIGAIAASVAWVIAGLLLAQITYDNGIGAILTPSGLRDTPGAVALLVSIIVPVFAFFAIAAMIRRSNEMRSTAHSMSEIALRLAEPENLAQERIVTVGQAVRREVSAMGEGIERTIARASELEALMQSEVSELERAYSDNEDLALLSGIDPDKVVFWAWVIIAALATIAGTLYGLDKSFKPFTYFQLLLPIFAAAIVGGIGNPVGAIVGGFLIAFSEVTVTYAYKRFLSYLVPESWEPDGLVQLLSTDYKFAVSFVILVLVLIFRPTGLFRGRVI